MNDLVFLESTGLKMDAFTTSGTIAEGTGIAGRKVKEAIRKHKADFETFGVLPHIRPKLQATRLGEERPQDTC